MFDILLLLPSASSAEPCMLVTLALPTPLQPSFRSRHIDFQCASMLAPKQDLKPQTCTHDVTKHCYALFFSPIVFAAFFRLLRIITTLRNVPTTAEPSRIKMTGMRMAHTRGRKRECREWSSSTKGWGWSQW